MMYNIPLVIRFTYVSKCCFRICIHLIMRCPRYGSTDVVLNVNPSRFLGQSQQTFLLRRLINGNHPVALIAIQFATVHVVLFFAALDKQCLILL